MKSNLGQIRARRVSKKIKQAHLKGEFVKVRNLEMPKDLEDHYYWYTQEDKK